MADEEAPTDLGRAHHARHPTGEVPGAFRVLADVTPTWWTTCGFGQKGQAAGRAMSQPLVAGVRATGVQLQVELLCPPGQSGPEIAARVESIARAVSAPSVGRPPGW